MILLKNLQEAPETKEGTNIVINDGAESEVLSLEIDGRSEQKTYNGNQLLDFTNPTSLVGDTQSSFINDILTVSSEGTSGAYSNAQWDITNLLVNNPNKVLHFDCDSFDFSNGKSSLVQLYIVIDGSTNFLPLLTTSGNRDTYTIPSDTSTITAARIRVHSNNVNEVAATSITITKPLLYFDGNNTYEPYVGGKASPSPDYPQEIESVGYENLFDGSNVVNGYITSLTVGDTLSYTNSSATVSYENCCYVKAGKKYTISYEKNTPASTNSRSGVIVDENNIILQRVETWNNSFEQLTFTAEYKGWLILVSDINTTDIQVEKSPIAHQYIANSKFGIEIKSNNKNMFNINDVINNTIASATTGILSSNNVWNTSDLIDCEPNTTYIRSSKTTGTTNIYLTEYDKNNNFVKVNYGISFTTSENTKYFRLCYRNDLGMYDIQLEKGSVATNYEEFKGNTSLITLNEPLRSLPNGVTDTYKDGVVTRRIGKVVLNGSEDWSYTDAGTTSERFDIRISKLGITNIKNAELERMNTHFQIKAGNSATWGHYYMTSSWLVIQNNNNVMNDLEEFKTWLSENNVEVLYELATPTTEIATISSELKILEPITNINNVFDANMRIKYNIYFEFDKILASGYHIKEDKDRTTQKFVNGNRKQIVSDYTDVQVAIDLAPFDLETTHKYLQQLKSGEYTYYSLNEKKYKKANMIIENKPEMTVDIAVDDDIYTSDFTVTLLKASDV